MADTINLGAPSARQQAIYGNQTPSPVTAADLVNAAGVTAPITNYSGGGGGTRFFSPTTPQTVSPLPSSPTLGGGSSVAPQMSVAQQTAQQFAASQPDASAITISPISPTMGTYTTPSGKVVTVPLSNPNNKEPSTSEISFNYQQRGTAYYNPQTKEYSAPTSTIVNKPLSVEDSFINFGKINFLADIRTSLITPKTYMVQPGASTIIKPVSIDDINRAKQLGERPIFSYYKPNFINYAFAGLIPTTFTQSVLAVGGTIAGGYALSRAPYLTSAGFATYGAINVPKYISATTPEEKANTASATLGLLGVTKLSELSFFGKKPYQIIPDYNLQKAIEPFTRQRATLMLTDIKGNYILGKSNGNEIISIGGGIERGQTARQAVLAELKQETGLSQKDISNLKFNKKIVTAEETFHVFTATLKPSSTIKPSSDIKEIIKISPRNPFIRGATGQTALQPVTRYVPLVGKVRAYEAGIINYLETGKKPTLLALDTPSGEYLLGTQSRYNVPFRSQKKYLNKQLPLAHGTPSPAVLKVLPIGKQKSFTVTAGETKRGQAQGLYLQPPAHLDINLPKVDLSKASIKQPARGYIGLSYLGFQTSQESGGIKVGFPIRTAYLFNEKTSGAIKPTPKTYSGMESELIITPDTEVSTVGKFDVASIGLKRVYLQPSVIGKVGKASKSFADISSESSYKYITPGEIISPFSSSSSINNNRIISYPSLTVSSVNKKVYSSIYPSSSSTIKSTLPSISSSRTFSSVAPSLSEAPSITESFTLSPIPSLSKVPNIIPSITPSPTPTYPPVPTPTRPSSLVGKRLKKEEKRVGTPFIAYLKRYGRFKPIGTAPTFKTALSLGERKALSTLGASIEISKAGKFVPLQADRYFRASKRSPNILVQRTGREGLRGGFLSSIGERLEIQAARIRKGGRK